MNERNDDKREEEEEEQSVGATTSSTGVQVVSGNGMETSAAAFDSEKKVLNLVLESEARLVDKLKVVKSNEATRTSSQLQGKPAQLESVTVGVGIPGDATNKDGENLMATTQNNGDDPASESQSGTRIRMNDTGTNQPTTVTTTTSNHQNRVVVDVDDVSSGGVNPLPLQPQRQYRREIQPGAVAVDFGLHHVPDDDNNDNNFEANVDLDQSQNAGGMESEAFRIFDPHVNPTPRASAESAAITTTTAAITPTQQDGQLFQATLVTEEQVVEAEPALEGFQALVKNKRFRFLMVGMIILILAIVIPVALTVKEREIPVTAVVEITGGDCGTWLGNQADYRGTINVSEGGSICLRWDNVTYDWNWQYPNHALYNSENFPLAGLDENYCRNPDGAHRAWCITKEGGQYNRSYCKVPYCGTEEVEYDTTRCGTFSTKQNDYRGYINKTLRGLTCQAWAANSPHGHPHHMHTFPQEGLRENYCRNPTGEEVAWCYTTDKYVDWDYCRVPICEVLSAYDTENVINSPQTCGTAHLKQTDYRGNWSKTVTGLTCQRWDQQTPHFHEFSPKKFTHLVENYCRNPESRGPGTWCYTTDPRVRYEPCEVPYCPDPECDTLEDPCSFPACEALCDQYDSADASEVIDSPQTCGSPHLGQTDYRGPINKTISGLTCQAWNSQTPHEHTRTAENYPHSNLTGNMCRNPDHEPRAWCYTTSLDVRWELCGVPDCPGNDLTQCGTYDWKQQDYIGRQNLTKSGLPCQAWASQTPNNHFELPELYPEANLVSNYCRNPTGDTVRITATFAALGFDNSSFSRYGGRPQEGAWCYVDSTEVVFEHCGIPHCTTEEQRERSFVCGSADQHQTDYRGVVAVSESGKRCQAWDSDFPHEHDYLPAEHPELESNYCRNPDAKRWRAWCMTTDVYTPWEFCNVTFC